MRLTRGIDMKKWLHQLLICPNCLPRQEPLSLDVQESRGDDVIHGEFRCESCGMKYPVKNGIAVLLPEVSPSVFDGTNGYNSKGMLSAYLWSHFSDLLQDPGATDAYKKWASLLRPSDGLALDIGCSVGRLSFEMSKFHRNVVGVDTSFSFIESARRLLLEKNVNFDMTIEGMITERKECGLNGDWRYDRVEFIVADALALPFPGSNFNTVCSVNILEKVPNPAGHLMEVNRVLTETAGRFIFSDPFSWDENVSHPDSWIGGSNDGPNPGRGAAAMYRLMTSDKNLFNPPLEIVEEGNVSWKIRKTENLWEHITSQFLVGTR